MNNFTHLENYPGYLINREGIVASSKSGEIRPMKTCMAKGYPYAVMSIDGKCRSRAVHRLVAETFIPQPMGRSQVNHKNGDPTDNRVENLEWVTPKQNIHHARDVLGVKFGNYKGVSKEEIHPIISLRKSGMTQLKIAGLFGVSQQTISRICKEHNNG